MSTEEYLKSAPLGHETAYVCHYDPAQLFPIPRGNHWQQQGFDSAPFQGCDIWNAYELSWLNLNGLPQVATAEFRFPCDSINIVESKSFKLYLNSFNLSRFESVVQVRQHLIEDLSLAAGAAVTVTISSIEAETTIGRLTGICLDHQKVEIEHYQPEPRLLSVINDEEVVDEQLYSHLLKSNCPVTGQPDWASVQISYQGAPIDRQGLLKYLVSYREHGDFHEHCVEQIFLDILKYCQPLQLTVYARYVRRGGLDINPFRSTESQPPENLRLVRQ
ncbi:MAG: NADPH-dependent 7-cyano-7-deazaguanine reductase QueF [Motiliproteus sp.]